MCLYCLLLKASLLICRWHGSLRIAKIQYSTCIHAFNFRQHGSEQSSSTRGLYGRALLSVLAWHFEVYGIVLPFGLCVDYGVGAPSEMLWEVPIQKAIIVNVLQNIPSCDMCKQRNQKHSIEKPELHPFQCTLYTSTLEYNSQIQG